MFPRLSLLFILLAACQLSSLANPKIDSLYSLLNQPSLSARDSAFLLSELGYEYWTVEPRKSVVYGRKALELAVELDLDERIAFSYRVIGVAYWALGDYPIALQNMLESLERYQQLEDNYGIGSMHMNIGLVYADQGSHEQAKGYFRAGQKIFAELGRTRSMATSYTKIASVLVEQDSLDLAKDYLHKAIELHRSEDFNYGLAEAYNRLGIVYREMGDFEASLDYLYRSRDRSSEINDFDGLAKCYSDIGFTQLAKADYKNALVNFEESRRTAEKIGSKKWKLEAFRGLAETYEKSGNKDLALFYFKAFQALHDSILNEQKIMAVANLQEEYRSRQQLHDLEFSKQQVGILRQQAENKNRLLMLLSFGGLLAFITVLLGIRNYRLTADRQNAEIENSRLKHEELARELELSQRELTSYALNFLQKNEFLSDLKKDLDNLKSTKETVRMRQKIHQAKLLDKDWEKFKMQFDKVHGSFASELKEKHPDLSPTELKHCSLIRINLNIKECASILGISPESAKTSRYRIRRKLGIDTEDSLFDYLSGFGR